MKQFLSVTDAGNPETLVAEALRFKADPLMLSKAGEGKTIGLIFLNPSLRTRMSTQKAAGNLGMQVMVINGGQDMWKWELEEGAVMNGANAEHIKDAARVISSYCDIISIRSFPGLTDREADYSEAVLNTFVSHCTVPVISLESATRHPLQSLADLMTIRENRTSSEKPKVSLIWAPHIKALPQAVPNSFAEWMNAADVHFRIAHPKGYELHPDFVQQAEVHHDNAGLIADSDFVYFKNWSAYEPYGALPPVSGNWLPDENIFQKNPGVRIMHCLPVRRNLEVNDALLDSPNSLIYQQAENRTYAAQAVIRRILEQL